MNKIFKTAMFFTAFIPLWFTVVFIDGMSIADKTNTTIGAEIAGISGIVAGLIISGIVIVGSMKGIRKESFKKYKILSVQQEKGITSEFLLSYILPLFAFDFTKWVSLAEF